MTPSTGETYFGLGRGHLSERVGEVAAAEGATLVNYTDAQDSCGYGCPPYACPKSARHWFAGPSRGEPFDGELARRVLAAIAELEPAK